MVDKEWKMWRRTTYSRSSPLPKYTLSRANGPISLDELPGQLRWAPHSCLDTTPRTKEELWHVTDLFQIDCKLEKRKNRFIFNFCSLYQPRNCFAAYAIITARQLCRVLRTKIPSKVRTRSCYRLKRRIYIFDVEAGISFQAMSFFMQTKADFRSIIEFHSQTQQSNFCKSPFQYSTS